MNIVVCIKQVPGTTQVKINPDTGTLVRDSAEAIVNPFDEYAIEEALKIKERMGGAVVKAITMGPPPPGYRFVRVASDILMISIGTGMVMDAVNDLGR